MKRVRHGERCLRCDDVVDGLRIMVPMFGRVFGPYCSVACAPEVPKRRGDV